MVEGEKAPDFTLEARALPKTIATHMMVLKLELDLGLPCFFLRARRVAQHRYKQWSDLRGRVLDVN